MRTKLFLAFLSVILIALVSNIIFKRLIIEDFDKYANGAREDRVYWILASVEGSRQDGRWDMDSLMHYLHWATMMGFDVAVVDNDGHAVMATEDLIDHISPSMRRRIEAFVELDKPIGEFDGHPLYVSGERVGELLIRRLEPAGSEREKEAVFKQRGRTFMIISFLIAGGGAVFLAVALSLYLTGPIKRLKNAATAVAGGDLSVRVTPGSGDELGRLNDAFNRMVESLEREEAIRKHLTSNIAHELRTPLSVIKANLEAIADGISCADEKTMAALGAETDRLIALVSGIEDITKAEAGFFAKAKPEPVELAAFISAVAGGMRRLFADKGLALDILPSGPINVLTEPEKLETIIKNVLSNALKFTDRGGVEISCLKDNGKFSIVIKDTGRGLSEAERSMIFRRFYKGEGSGGIGLGLAIVKEMLEVMGGSIDVQSSPGEGSTFRITLPDIKPE